MEQGCVAAKAIEHKTEEDVTMGCPRAHDDFDRPDALVRVSRGPHTTVYEVTRRQASLSESLFRVMTEHPLATHITVNYVTDEVVLAAIVEHLRHYDGVGPGCPLHPLPDDVPVWINGNTEDVLKHVFALPPRMEVDMWLVEFFRPRMHLNDRHAHLIRLMVAANTMGINCLTCCTAAVHAAVMRSLTLTKN